MKLFKKKQPTFYCKHCGKKHKSAFMAQLCFDLDMKILQYDDKKGKNQEIH